MNLHEVNPHQALNLARLPIPPLRRGWLSLPYDGELTRTRSLGMRGDVKRFALPRRQVANANLPHNMRVLACEDGDDFGLGRAAGDVDLLVGVNEDVYFAPDAELGQVDAGLNGEAGARQDAALFARLEVVHVGAVAMRLLADGVARAVAEILTVPCAVDHVADRLVHLPALNRRPFGKRALDSTDGRVAGTRDDLENLLVACRHRLADEPGPRQVAVDGPWAIEFGPQVDQHKIVGMNDAVRPGLRAIVRIAAVRADGADRWMVHHKLVFGKMLQNAAAGPLFRGRSRRGAPVP